MHTHTLMQTCNNSVPVDLKVVEPRGKSEFHVEFRADDCLADITTYTVDWDMWQTPSNGHDLDWKHEIHIRNAIPEVAERNAVKRAKVGEGYS